MNRKRVTLIIIGVVIAAAVFLLCQGIFRNLTKKQIFCGLEENRLRIPALFVEEMKNITRGSGSLWIHNIYVKNDSRSVCMNPIITIKFTPDIIGYVVNGTNADPRDKGQWIHIRNERDLILRPEKLDPNSFVDLTLWTNAPNILGESGVSLSSDSDFEIKTKYILYRTNEGRFR